MRKLICDICGKELPEIAIMDDDGFSTQYVIVEIQNRNYRGAIYDICNECYEDILKYAKEKGGENHGKDSKI